MKVERRMREQKVVTGVEPVVVKTGGRINKISLPKCEEKGGGGGGVVGGPKQVPLSPLFLSLSFET